MVYIPAGRRWSVENLDLGLSEGRWAFPASVRSDLSGLRLDDLVFFGVGAVDATGEKSGPRGGDGFAGWQMRHTLEAHVARVTRLPFENESPFWLDEHDSVIWNPTIEIELLRSYDRIPLTAGEALSFEATHALYRGGVSHRANLVPAAGSALFDEFPTAVLPATRVGRRSADQQRRAVQLPARLVGLETQRLARALVRARPETHADPAESRLVHAYADHLSASSGHVARRLLIPLSDGSRLYADLFCPERELLVEAKNAPSRNNIRLAIGQLFDYGRASGYSDAHRAVLVPSRPADDLLDLLSYVRIDAIWQDGSRFCDTRDGRWC
jgi:hypothetical protein